MFVCGALHFVERRFLRLGYMFDVFLLKHLFSSRNYCNFATKRGKR